MTGKEEMISRRDADFETKVLTALEVLSFKSQTIDEKAQGINERLDRLNGAVARHEARLGEVNQYINSHQSNCPLLADIEKQLDKISSAFEKEMAVRKAANDAAYKENSKWNKRVHPVLMFAMMFFLGLVLGHAPDMIKMLSK